MTNEAAILKAARGAKLLAIGHSDFFRHSSLGIRHSHLHSRPPFTLQRVTSYFVTPRSLVRINWTRYLTSAWSGNSCSTRARAFAIVRPSRKIILYAWRRALMASSE